ncbi:MAG TPA: ABC transporter ATP-binding protein [Methanothrix sp.]|jgi:lipopolysaccharide transport system ATP-binding protein|nr:ABC transporter ATP-binding protein [Methanothrix sp.]HOU69948.1 ABC transporter ATP-binding protein [Methanothrix sp.]HQE96607.1 ABC transporter ATP-binding protein [Methanothrix sp.]HQJ78951.1 ABC transporter ATP-binding protein [Methanothrix sp.]HUM80425.1 ABC transporter ATP-binding protein [Methanothrix sp.]
MHGGLESRIQKADTDQDGCAIAVDGISKRFRIPKEKKFTIFENLVGLLRGGSYAYEDFLALQGVSFSVQRGETFGVIGPNGCGKSTLLKVLAGVLYPDCGSFSVNGRIAPFLELGVGFQEELTARDNVYLYGAIMGLTKKDIDRRYEAIMGFAELKRFENMKLINFSSGMYVRLAFATAIQTDPDVLLVDEVLSVGDEAFQQKCSQKIDQIRSSGKTILLVSHDLEMVSELCERCLLMNGGKIVFLGDTESALDEYKKMRGK